MKYEKIHYSESSGDLRWEIRVYQGPVWILFFPSGGSCVEKKLLIDGNVWREGADELHGIYENHEEAVAEYNRL